MTDALVRPEDIPIPEWMRSHLNSYGPDAVVCADGSGSVLGWNPALAKLLGEEAPGGWILRPLSEILGWVDASLQEELFAEAETEGCARSDSSCRGQDGSLVPVEVTAVRASEPGEARCFFVYLRADSGRRVRRDLMDLQIQHRMLMNLAGGLVLVIERGSGKVLHANEAAEEYFRRPSSQIRGAVLADLLEEVEAFSSGEGAEMVKTASREIELSIPSPLGTAWVLQFRTNTISWHGGQAILWIGRDVTDRRAQPSAEPPAAADPDATGSAMQGHLPLRVISPVAESMRHPASQIELIARHCLDHPDRPWHETRERLEQIQELGDRVRSVSEDLLYLARILDGSLDIRRTETTVGRIMSAVLPRMQRRARSEGSEIMSVHVDEEAPIFSDARLLMHALRRFIDRALSVEGTTVTLTAAVEGDCVKFVIIDNGPAMPADRVARLLSPDPLTGGAADDVDRVPELPEMLAVRLFRALGGHVEIHSREGMGTRVALTLLS